MRSRLARVMAAAFLGVLSVASSARAAPVSDGSFSVDLGPEVCFVEPVALRDPVACAGFAPDKSPFGKAGEGTEAIAFGVFTIGSGKEQRMGAVTVVREPAHESEPTVASAERQFAETAKQIGASLALSRPPRVAEVTVQRANGLPVARGEITLDDPTRADTMLARMASVFVFTENGLYTITFSTPLAGVDVANRLRDRVLTTVHGAPPRASMASELRRLLKGNGLWPIGIFAIPVLLNALKRRRDAAAAARDDGR